MESETDGCWVSLQLENKDNFHLFSGGDKVVVYCNGNVAESYSIQISKVYAVTLKAAADRLSEELHE